VLEVFPNEPLELVDGDEPLTPWCLDRAHGGNEVAIDRRDADAEGLGGLLAAVGEALDLMDLAQPIARIRADLLLASVVPPLPFAAALSSRGHPAYSNPCVG
jgi:hypothetical protein